jgi:hypothetical protein
MSENENKSPVGEYWTKAIDTVTDTWNYFRDRSKILATSGTITSVQDALKNSPFKFAILSIIVPTLFVNGGLGAWKIFRDLPPTQVDRRIASDKEIEELSHRAALPPDGLPVRAPENARTDNRSTKELQREFDTLLPKWKARKPRSQMSPEEQVQYDLLLKKLKALAFEIAQRALNGGRDAGREGEALFHRERILLQAIVKFSDLQQSYWLLIVGGSLVLNASLFRYLLRRQRILFPHADRGDAIYLYTIGALLLLPQTAAALVSLIADLAVRYDWDRYLEYHNVLVVLVGIWGLLQLRRAAVMIAGAASGTLPSTIQRTMVSNRLVLSQFGSFLVIELLLAMFSIPVFLLILKLQK